jgi:hypothetical protein
MLATLTRALPLVFAVLAPTLVAAAAPAPSEGPRAAQLDIRVAPGGWGTAKTEDIEAVLRSVAGVLLPHFPRHASDRLVVRYRAAGPQVLAGKTADGAYVVFLDARDRRWDQMAYQFAHELCHVVTNFEHRDIESATASRSHHWFEEALCESMSLLALERMASNWEQAPPHPHWRAYAGAFRQYAQRLKEQAHRHLPAHASFAAWYRANRDALEKDPYLREKNELVAGIVLPLLEQTPGGLEATGYLNLDSPLDSPARGGSFSDYLERWQNGCPARYAAFVVRLIALVGGGNPPDGIAGAAKPPAQPLL